MTDKFDKRMNLRDRNDSLDYSALPISRGTPDWLKKKASLYSSSLFTTTILTQDRTEASNRAMKPSKNKRVKKPVARGKQTRNETSTSTKSNLAVVDEDQIQTVSHEMEDTWSVAEFRRRYIILQHKYCELEKNFVRKVKETCERHLKGVNKVTQEMKDALSRVEDEAKERCRSKDAKFTNYKESTDSRIETLQCDLNNALKKLVQYETKSKEAGIVINVTEESVMIPKCPQQSLQADSNTTQTSLQRANRHMTNDAAMEIDEIQPMIDLGQFEDRNEAIDQETSIQCVQNWSSMTRSEKSLKNEWNYERDQLKSRSKTKALPVHERASWGVDLCPEKRFVHFDGEIEVSDQYIERTAFETPVKIRNKESADFAYSMKKSPLKSRAEKLMSAPGGIHSNAETPLSSFGSDQVVNLGILPDLASIGFKCHLISENEALYQHVLTRDAFSLLCENFDSNDPAEIAYRPIKCHKLKRYLPEYLEVSLSPVCCDDDDSRRMRSCLIRVRF
eukprot:g5174.t1